MISEKIAQTYPNQFEEELLAEIDELGTLVEFKAGEQLISIDQYIKTMPIILKGAIKIMREDLDGGELLLYFLERGDTCAMTMACSLGERQSKVRAVAETDGEMVAIPITKMDQWLVKYHSWRTYVFNSYNHRLDEMLLALDNLAFNNMNDRLRKYLIEVASINNGHVINKTHQEIANELNTSRVVISRLLKAFEKEGFLELNRNTIRINVSAL